MIPRPTFRSRLRPIAIAMVLGAPLAGCVSLEKPNPERHYYVLEARRDGPALAGIQSADLAVDKVFVSPQYEGQEFVYRTGEFAYTTDYYNEFLIRPASLIRSQAGDWLVASGLAGSSPNQSIGRDTWTLSLSVPRLYADFRSAAEPKAVMEIQCFLQAPFAEGGAVVYHRTLLREVPLKDRSAPTVVAGWNQGFKEILSELETDLVKVDWSPKKRATP